jgi:hypothetical protein
MTCSSWQEYIEAAHRKVEIATYHADSLQRVVADHSTSFKSAPSIPVQAHFEGVVVSIMAAVDQVAQAVNSAWQLRLHSADLVEKAFTALAEHLSEIDDWFREPIGRDLRRLRVRIVHYAYEKKPLREEGPYWSVESAGTEYSGSRELLSYAIGTVEYGRRLRELLPCIKQELSDYSGRTAVGAYPQRAE